jgi:nicotinate-nucleotide adenylyltransferase
VTRVGILGGTFNPPHLGHLALARCALRELDVERVLLMPAHGAPHKPSAEDPGPAHRLQMCRLAVDGAEGLASCSLEIERGGPSYTVDTLRSIHASHPDVRLTFIVGADMAKTLHAWREPRELLGLTELAVAEREGAGREDVLGALAALNGGSADGPASVSFLTMEAVPVSSSLVRERVERSEPIEELVGGAVARYIAEHGLYRGESAVASR